MSDNGSHGTTDGDDEELPLGKPVVIPTVGSGEIATRWGDTVSIMPHEELGVEYVVPIGVARDWATGE